jgi:type VI secretion system secreted protein VgrG
MDMKTVLTQKKRELSISTPLDDDELVLFKAKITEELSQPFLIQAELLSENDNISINELMGQNVTISVETSNEDTRYFNGIVTQFNQLSNEFGLHRYEAIISPWLWLLHLSENCRIFQQITYLDILKEVFQELGISDFIIEATGDYAVQDYVVQFNESDFNFVTRIMEQEGVFYYFTHLNNKHTLVLTDSVSQLSHLGSYTFFPPEDTNPLTTDDVITRWESFKTVKTGGIRLTAFDFEFPSKALETITSDPLTESLSALEKFRYQGKYNDREAGSLYTHKLMERENALNEIKTGKSYSRSLSVGTQFTLCDHFREDQNKSHLITKSTYILQSDQFSSSSTLDDSEIYQCEFSAIESTVQFRPQQTALKPTMSGPQTAMVVGPAGKEIWTDKYGRIKVLFHWDRQGQGDENSSCWMRVSQTWAGKGWGQIQIPRIGQEVLIDFLGGDPDKPIVVGSVYNGSAMPPYDLPANATQSGTKSRSSEGGNSSTFNEFRFEDKQGNEEIHLHAQKDYDVVVNNNKTVSVKNDESIDIANNQTINIGNEYSIYIKGKKTEVIGDSLKTERHGDKSEWNYVNDSKKTWGFTNEEFLGAKISKNCAVTNELFAGAKFSNSLGISQSSFVGLKSEICEAASISKTSGKNYGEAKTHVIKGKDKISLSVGGIGEVGTSGILIEENSVTIYSPKIIFESGEKPAEFTHKGIDVLKGDVNIKKGKLDQPGGKTNIGG